MQDFLLWIEQQYFFDNTTIVITGDHLSMNTSLFDTIDPDYNRTTLEIFIHSAVEPINEKNREFSAFDMYPTTLASLGATIDGDRLGLGVNLFGDQQTLLEQYGFDLVNEQLGQHSNDYDKVILKGDGS